MRNQTHEADYQLIERFLNFELNEQELIAFDQRMENDETFRKRFYRYQEMEKMVTEQFLGNHSNTEQHTNTPKQIPPKVAKRASLVRWVGIAASILVVAIMGWFLYPSDPILSLSQLAASYWSSTQYQTLDRVSGLRSTTSNPSSFNKGLALYLKKQYNGSLAKLQQVTTSSEEYYKARLLEGQIYFIQQKWSSAIQAFESILRSDKASNKDLARWFQALAYLSLDNKVKAKANLDTILLQQYPIAKTAKQLLEQLK